MGFPDKGSSYPDLKNNMSTAKPDRDKLKLFAEQLKSVFATKIELKDKNLEREIGNFLILNIQDYSSLKSVDYHEEFISIRQNHQKFRHQESPGVTVNIHSPKKALLSTYLLVDKYSPVFFSQDKKTPGNVYLPVNKYCLGKYLLPFSYSATCPWTPL